MSENNYTKSEWALGGFVGADVFCGDNLIAETNPEGYYGDELVPYLETQANAHLISAAPDLLEACEKSFNKSQAERMLILIDALVEGVQYKYTGQRPMLEIAEELQGLIKAEPVQAEMREKAIAKAKGIAI